VFRGLVEDEFGEAYAATLMRTQHLTTLGGQTADEALAAGIQPRAVWLALCVAMDVPESRRFGRDIQPSR
jgi:hypothetical protein